VSGRRPLLATLCCAAALTAGAGPARAEISSPATVIDGPSADIVGLDSVAMAPDGTGGVVYRKRVGGRVHIFAARFTGGAWQRPQQVDAGQPFDSSWPAIGAGNGGRLVVVWVQAFGANVQDRMFSASLDPGATTFQAPIPIDLNVADGTDIWPSLAMNAGGQALLSYRVVTDRDLSGQGVPAGYVAADLRVQRYDGAFWSAVGTPIPRNPNQPIREPTQDNSPQVAIGQDGNGVVAWQEPDDAFVDRIWARRLFTNGTTSIALQASPATFGGKPLTAGADEFELAMRGFGTAAIAYRQPPGAGGPWTRARVLINQLPSAFTDSAANFEGARVIDGPAPDGPAGVIGPLSLAVDTTGDFAVGMALDDSSVELTGDETAVGAAARLDDGHSTIAGDPVLDIADDGALAAAFKVELGGADGVSVLEQRADGTPITQTLASPGGGDVGALKLAGSGLGDAAIVFEQGTLSGSTIVGTDVDAPPSTFDVNSPISWTRAANVPLTWDPADNAISGVTYSVDVDDQQVASDLTGTSYTLKRKLVGNGKHTISVVATDAQGQPTTGKASDLEIDRSAPKFTVKRRSQTLTLKVSDGLKGTCSGAVASATKVSFGDGSKAKGKTQLRHRYSRPGRYRLTVTTKDTAGNTKTTREVVVIK
jgi:hypothetical protein